MIDTGKLAEEARYNRVFVLRTNAKITPLQAVLRYRKLVLPMIRKGQVRTIGGCEMRAQAAFVAGLFGIAA